MGMTPSQGKGLRGHVGEGSPPGGMAEKESKAGEELRESEAESLGNNLNVCDRNVPFSALDIRMGNESRDAQYVQC